jgi:galactokinase
VNLIGEHIDYEGYSVLPMAIRQDTIIAIRKNESEKVLRIANVNDKYSMCTYPADPLQVQPHILCLSLYFQFDCIIIIPLKKFKNKNKIKLIIIVIVIISVIFVSP